MRKYMLKKNVSFSLDICGKWDESYHRSKSKNGLKCPNADCKYVYDQREDHKGNGEKLWKIVFLRRHLRKVGYTAESGEN